MYLLQHHNLHVGPGDIEIVADEHGQPWARGMWEQQAPAPLISLTHAEGSALAIAVSRSYATGVGIDLQRIVPRDADFDAVAFSAGERALLGSADSAGCDERRTRLWCAKEAAAKALGIGLVDGPHSVVVTEWNDQTGMAALALGTAPLERFPHLAGRKLIAYTRRDGEYIVATALGEGAWTPST
jgi:phosphopantetheinyl transferase